MIKGLFRSKLLVLGAILVAFPWIFYSLSEFDNERGLIWFVIYQLYYLPFGSWMSEPFFKPDSEIFYVVLFPGKLVAPIVYISLLYISHFLKNKIKLN